ncbi:ATP-dependent protease La [Microstroma glucosiphilum]|uniref:Lon protease homolog, mitochondrial n=1 Tax=Pseudomicrostroma glucosiphilum TaxID=1684307 RepID=A0A316U5L1_9BASI|nr:ATP-dependent protease La [Pseudomicrostroma glucosiphilum]PWN18245.1 ATP-dependent protease La [Pseudomicrostroma glucosiphilum]
MLPAARISSRTRRPIGHALTSPSSSASSSRSTCSAFVTSPSRPIHSSPPLQPRSKGKGAYREGEEGEEEEVDEAEDGKSAEKTKDKETETRSSSSSSAADGVGASSAANGAAAGGASGGDGSEGGSSSGSSSSESSSSRQLTSPTVPSVYPQVLALPITRRPLFPGFYKAVVIKDPHVCAAIKESLKRGQPYIGAFLLKDEEGDADTIENLDKVHRTGVFAQITSVFSAQSSKKDSKSGDGEAKDDDSEGLTAVLYPHRRIRIDELLPAHGSPQHAGGNLTPKDDGAHQDSDSGVVVSKDPSDAEAAAKGSPAEHIPSHGAPYQTSFLRNYPVSLVNVSNLDAKPYPKDSQVVRAIKSELISVFKDIATLNPLFRDQIANFSIAQGAGNVFEEPEKLADFAAAVSSGEVGELQDVLEALDVEERLQKALVVLKKELMNAQLQKKISKDVEDKIQKRQREYFLNEQLKGIKKELGIESDGKDKMVEKFKEKAASLKMPEAVRKVFDEELSKLQTLEPAASEFNVTRGYLEWLTNIPWGVHSPENYSIANATTVLDDDHYGLKDVKDRILEFLAVGKLRGTVQGKIICLVGPPGVGKTSIGKSISRALDRQFFRFSVGGLSDVAEIKGHRRTYVGAMPGKAIQALKKVGTENPLVLIDEVDKIGRGHNGDPSSALLEMLDPEQNGSFLDHYMDVPVDLSRVLFVCTANTLDTIPQPLLDRMEVIEVSSYTAEEKRHIAKGYLAPQAKEASGLKNANITLPDQTIEFLIKNHARESGVRSLRKLLEKVYRKIAFNIVREHGETVFPEPKGELQPASEEAVDPNKVAGGSESNAQSVVPPPTPSDSKVSSIAGQNEPSEAEADNKVPARDAPPSPPPKTTTEERKPMEVPPSVNVTITIESLKEYLGPPAHYKDRLFTRNMPSGVANGLGYLGNGSGSLMPIETTLLPSKEGSGGSIQLTGKLGEVIKESANIALSFLKSNGYSLGLAPDEKTNILEGRNVHLHMPEGSIGKEGPSAGVAFVVSLTSLLTDKLIKPDLAMTGEVSLRGMVLPVGGLKEKLLAAHRSGIKTLILPLANRSNVETDVPENVRKAMEIHYVGNVWSALEVAFGEGAWSQRAREMKAEEENEEKERKEEEQRERDAQTASSPSAPEPTKGEDGANKDQPVN